MMPAPIDKQSLPGPAAVTVYIGIGANLGDAQASIVQAFGELDALPQTRVTARSALYRSAPIDADGDDYVNAVAALETGLRPEQLLNALLSIERHHGRARTYRNAPRPLDLDILLYGQQVVHTDALTIPHPRLTQRAFALVPLLQIAPAITIPGAGQAHLLIAGVAGQGICMITP